MWRENLFRERNGNYETICDQIDKMEFMIEHYLLISENKTGESRLKTDDLSNAEYHLSLAISSTAVKTVASKSIKHWKGQKRTESIAFDVGTAFHDMVLEGGINTLRGPEDRRGNKWKEARAKADFDNKLLMTESDYDLSEGMAKEIMRQPLIAEIIEHAEAVKEQSIFVKCPETNLELRCRPDLYIRSAGIVLDLKSTVDARPTSRGFESHVWNYGYDIQAAFYRYVLEIEGINVRHFYFACTEKQPPFASCLFEISDEVLDHAHNRMINVLHRIKEAESQKCFDTGWPTVNKIYLPEWMKG